MDKDFDLDPGRIAEFCIELFIDKFEYKNIDKNELVLYIAEFIAARYRFRLEKNGKRTDIFDAVMQAGCSSILELDKKYAALAKYISEGNDILALSEPLIRCKNIIKGKETGPVVKELLSCTEESGLFSQLLAREERIKESASRDKYYEALLELSGFADSVNLFFDKVLVMDKDETIRQNRINLVKRCAELYLNIADFSKIATR